MYDAQAVTEQQAQREVMFSAGAKAARRNSAAAAMLPRVFDTLRAYYGAAGPAVKPYEEVRTQNSAFREHVMVWVTTSSLPFHCLVQLECLPFLPQTPEMQLYRGLLYQSPMFWFKEMRHFMFAYGFVCVC